MRLFYDEPHKIFMALDSNYQVENRHYPMSMNKIGNQATGKFEKARILCSKGNLNSKWSHIRIGTDETLLDLIELSSRTSIREVSLLLFFQILYLVPFINF